MIITQRSVKRMTPKQKIQAKVYVCAMLGITQARPNYLPGDIIFTATQSMDFVVKDLNKKPSTEEVTRLGPGDTVVLHAEKLNFTITVTPLFKSHLAKL